MSDGRWIQSCPRSTGLAPERLLRQACEKVRRNVEQLQSARVEGTSPYQVRLAELELHSAAKVAELLAPGQVLLRLALAGFGVALPPP